MDYQKMAEYRNTNNPYVQRQNVLVEEIGPGYARVTKTVTPEDVNPLGVPPGGVYFTMADTACGSAMASYGSTAVTMNANYNFFRSANVGDRLTTEAKEVKHGQTVSVFDVRSTNQKGTLLGTGTFTFYQLPEKLDI